MLAAHFLGQAEDEPAAEAAALSCFEGFIFEQTKVVVLKGGKKRLGHTDQSVVVQHGGERKKVAAAIWVTTNLGQARTLGREREALSFSQS